MGHRFSKVMFTQAVQKLQEKYGSRQQYERMAERGPSNEELGPDEIGFIGERDSFYIASEGENGWPYLQHRGGPKGFLKVLDGRTLGFADFAGNKQFVTMGNISVNDKVTLFLMDYPHQTRLKILGHASFTDLGSDAKVAERLLTPGYAARPERAVLIKVVAFDWNCPQHITPRYTQEEILEQLGAGESRAQGA